MNKLTVLGPENRPHGSQARVDALFRLYPWLGDICAGRRVSVITVLPASEMPTYNYSVAAQGYNTSGDIIFLKKRGIVKKVRWEEVWKHRRELGLPDRSLNSPQTELVPDAEACVLVQEHHAESNYEDTWISMEVFVCPSGREFDDLPSVRTWMEELTLREELQGLGLVPNA